MRKPATLPSWRIDKLLKKANYKRHVLLGRDVRWEDVERAIAEWEKRYKRVLFRDMSVLGGKMSSRYGSKALLAWFYVALVLFTLYKAYTLLGGKVVW